MLPFDDSPPDDEQPEGPVPIEVEQAQRFLTSLLGDGVTDVELIGSGDWSCAYSFHHRGGDFVVRFGKFLEDFAKDQRAASFASPCLPIPRVAEIGEAFDSFYVISERAFGVMLDDLDGAHMRRVLPSLLDALDAARLVDLSGSTGYGGWQAGGMAAGPSWHATLLDVTRDEPADRVHGWRAQLAASPTGDGPFFEALSQMTALLPHCPESRHLIHADLLHRNVLVADDHVSAIFDWGCSMYGDFLYDVAWLSFWSVVYPAWRGIDFRREARHHYASIGLEVPHFDERVRCYELHIGLGGQAYSAFRQRWEWVDWTAKRTLALAVTPPDGSS